MPTTGPRGCRRLRPPRRRSRPRASPLDGEAVVLGPDGLSRFEALRRREAAHTAILYAFDLIEHDGEDLRDRPFLDRKARVARLLRGVEAAFCSTNTSPRGRPHRVRARLPAWRRGHAGWGRSTGRTIPLAAEAAVHEHRDDILTPATVCHSSPAGTTLPQDRERRRRLLRWRLD